MRKHVYKHTRRCIHRMCVGVGTDTCTDPNGSMGGDMCIDMSIDRHKNIRRDMCMDMC